MNIKHSLYLKKSTNHFFMIQISTEPLWRALTSIRCESDGHSSKPFVFLQEEIANLTILFTKNIFT